MSRSSIQICTLLAGLLLPAVAQAQFTFTTNNGALTVKQYTGSSAIIIIPDNTNGMPVTTIGTNAFYFNNQCNNITIPDSITNIGMAAFYSCSSLTNISFGTNVTTIGNQAFYDCYGLTNFIIPDSVISLGNSTFMFCRNLAQIKIGNSVTNIGVQDFYNCNSLKSVIIPDSVITIGTGAFSGGSGNQLSYVKFGRNLTTIGDYAFTGTALTSVNIPDNVTSIGSSAFTIPFMTQVTFGIGITNLASGAFSACYNLIAAYFRGNAPAGDSSVFSSDTKATVYYLPGTTGWGTIFGSRPTVLWNPQAQTGDGSFGVLNNQFGFNITGSSNLVIVVEAATNLSNPVWVPVGTNSLNTFIGTNGTSYFSDLQWTNYPGRFYRFRSP